VSSEGAAPATAAALPAENPNIAARLAERAARHPGRLAIVEYRHGRARRIDFGELSARVAGFGAGLSRRGVVPGDAVLLFVPMSIDLYVALLGTLHLGAIAVFVDAWADPARLAAAVDATRPKAFVGVPRAHLLRVMNPAVRSIPIAVVAGRGLLSLDRFERPGLAAPATEVSPGTPALVTFTTGSTGRPKAATRTHGFLWAQHEVLAEHLGITGTDIDMPALPVFVLNNLAIGASSVLPDFDPRRPADNDPGAIFAQMTAERVTTTSGSPAFYERLAAWCASNGKRLAVRALFTGGAPVMPPLARLLADAVEGKVHVVYGSTEAEPIASIEAREMLRAMEADSRRSSDATRGGTPGEKSSAVAPEKEGGVCVGPPVPQIDLRLIQPHDGPVALGPEGWSEWDVPRGEVGEVVVTGAHVLPAYRRDPEANRLNKIRDGGKTWHRTGDGGRLDEQGRLWLMGRVKQRVRRGDRVWWSTPAEVRALSVEGVRHAAYLGRPDPALGQRAVLCVEVPDGRLTEEASGRLRAALSPIPVDEIRALEHIPRDPRHRSKTDVGALSRVIELQ